MLLIVLMLVDGIILSDTVHEYERFNTRFYYFVQMHFHPLMQCLHYVDISKKNQNTGLCENKDVCINNHCCCLVKLKKTPVVLTLNYNFYILTNISKSERISLYTDKIVALITISKNRILVIGICWDEYFLPEIAFCHVFRNVIIWYGCQFAVWPIDDINFIYLQCWYTTKWKHSLALKFVAINSTIETCILLVKF